MLSWANLIAGFVVGAVVATLFAYPIGMSDGKSIVRQEAAKAVSDAIIARNATNEDVKALSPNGVCVELGGVWADGKCD